MADENQEVSNQENLEGQESQNPASQQNQSTNIEQLIQTTLAEAERNRIAAENRARALEDELNNLKRAREVAPIQNVQNNDPNEFWKNPVENINNLIAAQVKPLVDFTRGMNATNQYQQLKNQYRNYNGFSDLEPFIDQIMNGQEPTHGNIQAAIQRAIGHIALNRPDLLSKINGTVVNNNNNNNQIDLNNNNQNNQRTELQNQAHLRPSNRNTPVDDQSKGKKRALTENERRICREMNITEDKYLELLTADSRVDGWAKKPEGKK